MILFTSDERIFSNLTTIWSICFYHRLSESQKDSVASQWFLFSIIKFLLYTLLPNIKNGICHLSLQILDGFHAFDLMLISKHFFNIIFFFLSVYQLLFVFLFFFYWCIGYFISSPSCSRYELKYDSIILWYKSISLMNSLLKGINKHFTLVMVDPSSKQMSKISFGADTDGHQVHHYSTNDYCD